MTAPRRQGRNPGQAPAEPLPQQVGVSHIDFPIHWDSVRYRVTNRIRRVPSDRLPVSLAPAFLGCNRVLVRRDTTYPPHQHTEHELIIVERGPYQCRLNGEKLEVREGSCLLIKPGDHHEVECQRGQCYHVLHFRLGLRDPDHVAGISIFTPRVTAAQQVIAVPGDDLKPALAALRKAEARGHAGRFAAELQDCLVEQVVWMLLSAVSPDALSGAFTRVSRGNDWVERFQAAIASAPPPSLSLEFLAAKMRTSRSSLNQHCRQLLGETPAGCLMRYKVAFAASLLRETGCPIKEASFAAGFKNPHHFARVFKRCTGQTPTRFRGGVGGVGGEHAPR